MSRNLRFGRDTTELAMPAVEHRIPAVGKGFLRAMRPVGSPNAVRVAWCEVASTCRSPGPSHGTLADLCHERAHGSANVNDKTGIRSPAQEREREGGSVRENDRGRSCSGGIGPTLRPSPQPRLSAIPARSTSRECWAAWLNDPNANNGGESQRLWQDFASCRSGSCACFAGCGLRPPTASACG